MNLETIGPVGHRIAIDLGAIVAAAASRMASWSHVFVGAFANPIGKPERVMRGGWPTRNQYPEGKDCRTKYRNPAS